MNNPRPQYSDFYTLTPEQERGMTPNERRAAKKAAQDKYKAALKAWGHANRLKKQQGKVDRATDEFNRKNENKLKHLRGEAKKEMRRRRIKKEQEKERAARENRTAAYGEYLRRGRMA